MTTTCAEAQLSFPQAKLMGAPVRKRLPNVGDVSPRQDGWREVLAFQGRPETCPSTAAHASTSVVHIGTSTTPFLPPPPPPHHHVTDDHCLAFFLAYFYATNCSPFLDSIKVLSIALIFA